MSLFHFGTATPAGSAPAATRLAIAAPAQAAQTTTTPASTAAPSTTMAASTAMSATPHFNIGQLLGTILLGAEDSLIAYTNPSEIPSAVANFTQGIMSIWFPTATPAAPTTTGTPAVTPSPAPANTIGS